MYVCRFILIEVGRRINCYVVIKISLHSERWILIVLRLILVPIVAFGIVVVRQRLTQFISTLLLFTHLSISFEDHDYQVAGGDNNESNSKAPTGEQSFITPITVTLLLLLLPLLDKFILVIATFEFIKSIQSKKFINGF